MMKSLRSRGELTSLTNNVDSLGVFNLLSVQGLGGRGRLRVPWYAMLEIEWSVGVVGAVNASSEDPEMVDSSTLTLTILDFAL